MSDIKPYVTAATLAEKTKTWLKKVQPFDRPDLKLNRAKAALLVVDMQKFFLTPGVDAYTEGGSAIIPNLKKLIKAFRAAGRPVIYTRHVHKADKSDAGIMGWWWQGMCLEGSPESEVHPEIAPLPGEKVIFKHRYSSFYNTDLEIVLRCLGIEDVVVTGIMTNLCCETTAREAYMRDFRVFFPADGTGASHEDMHQATLLNLSFGFAAITTVDDLILQIK